MNLTEIKGEKAIEMIAELIEPVSAIANDAKVKEIFNIVPEEGEKPEEAAMRVLTKKTPELMKHYAKEIAQILGILLEVKPEELSIAQIFKGLAEMIADKSLMQLFSSAVLPEEPTPLTERYNK